MKQSCNGCRALSHGPHEYYCDLGYKIESRNTRQFKEYDMITPVPLEQCPKPKTWEKWNKAKIEGRDG